MRVLALCVVGCVLGLPASGCLLEPIPGCDPSEPACRDAGFDAGPRDASDADSAPIDGGACGAECDADHCVGGECVECTPATEASDCTGPATRCLEGECVGCIDASDCGEPALARCDLELHECTQCEAPPDCAHLTGRGVCGGGTCVQCTASEDGACGGNPCTSGNTCSEFGDGSQRPCEPCDTDANCGAGYFCVPMQYDGADRPGGYCLKTTTGGCDQPFSIATPARPTLSGASGMFCGINEGLTTCEAVRALLDNQTCPVDTDCPEGGICRTVGTLMRRCTYECQGPAQCASFAPGDTCGDGPLNTGPDYCGG